jgi:hypothetical protein
MYAVGVGPDDVYAAEFALPKGIANAVKVGFTADGEELVSRLHSWAACPYAFSPGLSLSISKPDKLNRRVKTQAPAE